MKTKYWGLLCAVIPLFLLTSCMSLIKLVAFPVALSHDVIGRNISPARLIEAIDRGDIEKVRSMMDDGFSPDRGMDNEINYFNYINPLDHAIFEAVWNYDPRWRESYPENNPQRVEIIKLLVERGADINRAPYIWSLLNTYGNERELISIAYTDEYKYMRFNLTHEEVFQQQLRHGNGILKLLLDMGFDPEKKRNRYSVYDYYSKSEKKIEDDERYGSRPLNEAIQMGMLGESKVDLLLQYSSLDEESLWAAWNSHDPGMLEKIERLWAEHEGR